MRNEEVRWPVDGRSPHSSFVVLRSSFPSGGGGAPRLRKPPGRLRAVRTPPSTGEEHPTTKSRRAPRGSEFSRSCVRRSSPAAVLRDLGAFVVQLCTRLGATALAEPVAHGSRPSAFSFPLPPPLPDGRGSWRASARPHPVHLVHPVQEPCLPSRRAADRMHRMNTIGDRDAAPLAKPTEARATCAAIWPCVSRETRMT